MQKLLRIKQHFIPNVLQKFTNYLSNRLCDFFFNFLIMRSCPCSYSIFITKSSYIHRISRSLSSRMLLISWWFFLFVRTKNFISSSEITVDKAMLYRVRKYGLKTQIHTPKKITYVYPRHCLIFISQSNFI